MAVSTRSPLPLRRRPGRRQPAAGHGQRHRRGTRLAGGQLGTADPANGPVLVLVAPAGVSVSRRRPEGKEENTWPGQVSAVNLLGDRVRVRITGTPDITAEVLPAAVDELKLDDGGELWASVSPSAVSVYPP